MPSAAIKSGLVTVHHNELSDGVADLSGKSFTQTHVRDNPLIFGGRAVQKKKAKPSRYTHTPSKKKSEATKNKGNLLICDLW